MDLENLTNNLRIQLAIHVAILTIWSAIWFFTFLKSYRERRRNGPTVALIIKFGANSLFYGYLTVGFVYLASPYVTPARSVLMLIWGVMSSLGIIVSYIGLQWTFGSSDES